MRCARRSRELPEREQQILMLRYGLNGEEDPKSLEEIGRILGITRERVRQLEGDGAPAARPNAARSPECARQRRRFRPGPP